MKQLAVICFCFLLHQNITAQGFSKAEYFFDNDPGVDNSAFQITLGGVSNTLNFTITASTVGLSTGFHLLGLRIKDNNGSWGLIENRGFYISTVIPAANIVAAEYFFDTDPGPGNATPTNPGLSGATVNFTAVIPVSLSAGFHTLSIRTKDANGTWSLFENRGFYISAVTPGANIIAAEYFFDNDPGPGNATVTNAGISGATVNFTAVIPVSLSPGFHVLSIRTKDANGTWSLYENRAFYVFAPQASASITSAEYFFDTDPGVGNGTALAITTPGSTINQTFSLTVPSGTSQGQHTAVMRVKDANGTWSLFEFAAITVDGVLPVTFTGIRAWQQGANIAVEWKVTNQLNIDKYEVQRSTDGSNFNILATKLSNGINGSDATYNWLDVSPAVGNNFYRVRSIGYAGDSKNSSIVKVVMGKTDAVITISPNPVTNKEIGIQLTGMARGVYHLRLINTAGQVVFIGQLIHGGGSSFQTIGLNKDVAAGNHQLEITGPDGNRIIKGILVAN